MTSIFIRTAIVVLATAIGALSAGAQQPAAAPRFDAASLKVNRSGSNNLSFTIQPGGRVVAVNVPLRTLVGNAYRVQGDQVIGAPSWYAIDRFDLIATAGTAAREQVALMLQSLLVDRFKLVVHRETREMPIYSLILARPDGALGPGLKPSALDCSGGTPGAPPLTSAPGAARVCGTNMNGGTLSAGGTTLAQVAANLSGAAGRTIVDGTGLTGAFDVNLTFSITSGAGGGAAPNSDTPTIFTALQEQLGLRLQAATGPIEVLVIDHVEKPTED